MSETVFFRVSNVKISERVPYGAQESIMSGTTTIDQESDMPIDRETVGSYMGAGVNPRKPAIDVVMGQVAAGSFPCLEIKSLMWPSA